MGRAVPGRAQPHPADGQLHASLSGLAPLPGYALEARWRHARAPSCRGLPSPFGICRWLIGIAGSNLSTSHRSHAVACRIPIPPPEDRRCTIHHPPARDPVYALTTCELAGCAASSRTCSPPAPGTLIPPAVAAGDQRQHDPGRLAVQPPRVRQERVDTECSLVLGTPGTSGPAGALPGQGAPRPDTARAWEALEQAIIGKAVDLVSGPGGLASFLRCRQLGARLGGPSLPLDVGSPGTSRPRSGTPSSCATSTAGGPAAATSPPPPARCTTSPTRPTAASERSGPASSGPAAPAPRTTGTSGIKISGASRQSSPENRSHAACLDTPSASPMRVQLMPRARRVST